MEIVVESHEVVVPQVGMDLLFFLGWCSTLFFSCWALNNTFRPKMNLLCFSQARQTLANFLFPSWRPISKSSRTHCLFLESSFFCFDGLFLFRIISRFRFRWQDMFTLWGAVSWLRNGPSYTSCLQCLCFRFWTSLWPGTHFWVSTGRCWV